MRKIYLVSFFYLITLVSCKEKHEDYIDDKKSKVTKEYVSKISYEKALNYYGEPSETTVFENAKENVIFPGIRAGVGKYYASGVKINIKEAIWNKNDSIQIAVWYIKKQNQWVPFDSFEYSRHSDF